MNHPVYIIFIPSFFLTEMKLPSLLYIKVKMDLSFPVFFPEYRKRIFDIALVAKSIDPLSTTIFRCNEFTDREKRVGDYF